MDERNSQYELQRSRNGLTVPVMNGVYLHSIYNPVKEAEAFIDGHAETLKYKNKVLVLGLGFGYHVEEIARHLNSHHGDYEIIILEPNQRLIDDFISTRKFEDTNIKIIFKEKIKDLFTDWNFVSYLMNKPCIIKHDASFILNKDYFTKFLAYQAPKDILNYKSILTEKSQSIFNENLGQNLDSYVQGIKESGKKLERNDFLLLALEEIKNLNYQG